MNIKFLGRGSAFFVKEGNTSGYFIEDDHLFLIDCGETVFERLVEKKLLSNIKNIYVLISHMHSDHCGSLGSVGLYCQFVLNTKLKIIVPHHEEYQQQLEMLMTLFGNTKNAYEFIYEEQLDNQFHSFSKVRYDLTLHDYQLTCFSFVFETDQGAIFYSADTRTLKNLDCFMKTYQTIDKIYMEVTDIYIPDDIHLYIDHLIEYVDKKWYSKIWIMHIRSDDCMKKVLNLGFHVVNSYKELI